MNIGGQMIKEGFSPYGFAGVWNNYGFAVWADPTLIGHTGGTPGAGAIFAMDPRNLITIVILSNNGAKGEIAMYKALRHDLGYNKPINNL